MDYVKEYLCLVLAELIDFSAFWLARRNKTNREFYWIPPVFSHIISRLGF